MNDTKFTARQVEQQIDLIKRNCYHAAGNFLDKTTPVRLHEDLANWLEKIHSAHEAEIKAIKQEQNQ